MAIFGSLHLHQPPPSFSHQSVKNVNDSRKCWKWSQPSCIDAYKWKCSLLTLTSITNPFFFVLSSDICQKWKQFKKMLKCHNMHWLI
jgi:hypothetical protein